MYVGDARCVVAVLAAVCCCHGDGQQQCVVAMEEMTCRTQPLATMYCTQCVFGKHLLRLTLALVTQRFGHNVLHKNTHTHTAVAYNTTLWPQSIAPKHTQTGPHVAREDFITQRFGHNVLHPNTHTQR